MAQNIQATGNGGDGIRMGPASVIVGCAAQRNGRDGLQLGSAGVLADCQSRDNGRHGISVADCVTLSSSTARENRGHGILAGRMVAVLDTAVRNNGGDGIRADAGSLVAGSIANDNASNGVTMAGAGAKVHKSSAYGNGIVGFSLGACSMIEDCAARSNTNGGIRITNGCYALNNVMDSNAGGPGLWMQGVNSRIENNHALKGGIGFLIAGTNNLIVKNTAFANTTTNYSIAPGNHLERVVNPGTVSANWEEPWASYDLY
jgi:parallel beta-helix repeat protein